jgi:CBS domain-containing protein
MLFVSLQERRTISSQPDEKQITNFLNQTNFGPDTSRIKGILIRFPEFFNKHEKEADPMETKLVREVMIPIKSYVTVQEENSLFDAIQTLESSKTSNRGRAHRDAVVVDKDGIFIGKVTMIDIFRALEPNYNNIDFDKIIEAGKGELTEEIVTEAYKDFSFWVEPSKTICERGEAKKISEVMHMPTETEYIKEEDSIEKALHLYVMGAHQPLIVKKGETVTGMLRFGDVFEVVREALLSC